MPFGDDMVLTLFTNDAALARRADAAGVDRVGLDLETIGKDARQAGLGSWISDHAESQLPALRDALSTSRLFVRTNPLHAALGDEIDRYIGAGASTLMLPMFHTVEQAQAFVELIDGRAQASLLVETPAAAMRLHDIARIPGVSEIHIGLNDMHLGMNLDSHFEVLVSDFIDTMARTVIDAGLPFGFGGVGRLHDDGLPVPSDLIYAQYARLGATRALVSRVFVTGPDPIDLTVEVRRCRDRLSWWRQRSDAELLHARDELRRLVRNFCRAKRARRSRPEAFLPAPDPQPANKA